MPQRIRKLSVTTLALLAFILAAMVMFSVAYGASLVIESRTQKVVTTRLAEAGVNWITVETDGLQVRLNGTAPNEADRFSAVSLVGAMIDASRIRDLLDVTPTSAIEAPKFSVEMLRTEDEVQLSGLIPQEPGPDGMTEEALSAAAEALAPGTELPDMLDTADYPAPDTWDEAPCLRARGIATAETLESLRRGREGRSDGNFPTALKRKAGSNANFAASPRPTSGWCLPSRRPGR